MAILYPSARLTYTVETIRFEVEWERIVSGTNGSNYSRFCQSNKDHLSQQPKLWGRPCNLISREVNNRYQIKSWLLIFKSIIQYMKSSWEEKYMVSMTTLMTDWIRNPLKLTYKDFQTTKLMLKLMSFGGRKQVFKFSIVWNIQIITN